MLYKSVPISSVIWYSTRIVLLSHVIKYRTLKILNHSLCITICVSSSSPLPTKLNKIEQFLLFQFVRNVGVVVSRRKKTVTSNKANKNQGENQARYAMHILLLLNAHVLLASFLALASSFRTQ